MEKTAHNVFERDMKGGTQQNKSTLAPKILKKAFGKNETYTHMARLDHFRGVKSSHRSDPINNQT